ncbi:hypothetical protein EVA_01129 [gut metagenome]|uniref:Uncharacterized protein n=1 Tax=gut metagenome TaxID=749906 RepID=J9H3E5_9ZZZZ
MSFWGKRTFGEGEAFEKERFEKGELLGKARLLRKRGKKNGRSRMLQPLKFESE